MVNHNIGQTPSTRKRDALVAGLILASVLAITAWRMTAQADSAPPPPSTSTTTTTTTTLPDSDEGLADGTTFVWVREVTDDGLVVDPAEVLTGEAARAAAEEDGVIGPGEDLPNDIYIKNNDTDTVRVVTAPDAELTVLTFDDSGNIVEENIKLHELEVAFTGDYAGHVIYGLVAGEFPVTVTVKDGVVTGFVQLYLP